MLPDNPFLKNLSEIDGIDLQPEDIKLPSQEEEFKYSTTETFGGDLFGAISESEKRQQSEDKKRTKEDRQREFDLFGYLQVCLKALEDLEVEYKGVKHKAFETIWTKLVRTTLIAPIANDEQPSIEGIIDDVRIMAKIRQLQQLQTKLRYYRNLSPE